MIRLRLLNLAADRLPDSPHGAASRHPDPPARAMQCPAPGLKDGNCPLNAICVNVKQFASGCLTWKHNCSSPNPPQSVGGSTENRNLEPRNVPNLCTPCANTGPTAHSRPANSSARPSNPAAQALTQQFRPNSGSDPPLPFRAPEFHRCTILMELTTLRTPRTVAALERLATGDCFKLDTLHFRATIYSVSLLTGTIYGSTLSIPEYFCTPQVLKEASTINAGARLKVEVTSRLPLPKTPPSA